MGYKECARIAIAKVLESLITSEKNNPLGLPPPNMVFTNPELAKFQPRELLVELKARGYVWEKMYAPRIEIKYEKI